MPEGSRGHKYGWRSCTNKHFASLRLQTNSCHVQRTAIPYEHGGTPAIQSSFFLFYGTSTLSHLPAGYFMKSGMNNLRFFDLLYLN